MPFIELAKDALTQTEAQLVPEGEYDLRCVKADYRKDRNQVWINIEVLSSDISNPRDILHILSFGDKKNDDEDAYQFKNLMNQRFLEAFGITYDGNGFNTDDILGATATLSVTQVENAKVVGEFFNNIKLPPIKQAA